MAEISYNIANFSLKSTFTDENRGTLAETTKTVTVSGIPSNAQITSAVMHVTLGSPLSGVAVSQIAGQTVQAAGQRQVDLSGIITGNGSFSITFLFRANGNMPGSHTSALAYSAITVVINYTGGGGPEPEPEPEPEQVTGVPASNDICIFAPTETDWSTNGNAILLCSKCVVSETAGEDYSISLEHPMTEDGRWRLIIPGAIVRVPVPNIITPDIELADASFWKATVSTKVYARPATSYTSTTKKHVEITTDSYFQPGNWYEYGAVVVVTGLWTMWRYIANESKVKYDAPTANDPDWEFIGNVQPQATSYEEVETKTVDTKIVATLAAGEVFTTLAVLSEYWLQIKTAAGVTGYVQRANCQEYGDSSAHTIVEGRNIQTQCFRLHEVKIDSESQSVSAYGLHISYDLQQVMLSYCNVTGSKPNQAIAIIQAAEIGSNDSRQIVTSIDSGSVIQDYSWGNALSAIIDPDAGLVAKLDARLIRDNGDFFILPNEKRYNGYRIERGVNLISISWERSYDDVVTRVIPLGKTKKGEILMLSDSEPWVDSPNIDDYPVIRAEILDVDAQVGKPGTINEEHVESLTEEQVKTIMRMEATKRFTVDKADKVKNTVTVQFQELADTIEHGGKSGMPELRIYDMVYIYDSVSGLEDRLQMTGYQWDCTNPKRPYYSEITLGELRTRNVWNGFNIRNGAVGFSKLSNVAKTKIGEMIADATAE